jgi:hypothetical protein
VPGQPGEERERILLARAGLAGGEVAVRRVIWGEEWAGRSRIMPGEASRQDPGGV